MKPSGVLSEGGQTVASAGGLDIGFADVSSADNAAFSAVGSVSWRLIGPVVASSVAPVAVGVLHPLLGGMVALSVIAVAVTIIGTALFGSSELSKRAFRLMCWFGNRPEPRNSNGDLAYEEILRGRWSAIAISPDPASAENPFPGGITFLYHHYGAGKRCRIISSNGRADLIAADDYGSMSEIDYLLRSPANASRLMIAADEVRCGRTLITKSMEELRAKADEDRSR